MSNVIAITEKDVLCGRDRLSHSHPGNRVFRKLVDEVAARYQQSSNRRQKTEIIQRIVGEIHEIGGRFLKLEDNLVGIVVWNEMDALSIHQKVAHALRSKQVGTKGSLRSTIFDSLRSTSNASSTSSKSMTLAELEVKPESTLTTSYMKRQSDSKFLDTLMEQQESLLQNLHISVEFNAHDEDEDDDRSQCSQITTSSTASDAPDAFQDHEDESLAAEDVQLLVSDTLDDLSTTSTYFYALDGTRAEF